MEVSLSLGGVLVRSCPVLFVPCPLRLLLLLLRPAFTFADHVISSGTICMAALMKLADLVLLLQQLKPVLNALSYVKQRVLGRSGTVPNAAGSMR